MAAHGNMALVLRHAYQQAGRDYRNAVLMAELDGTTDSAQREKDARATFEAALRAYNQELRE
jgi:hypothetical protein